MGVRATTTDSNTNETGLRRLFRAGVALFGSSAFFLDAAALGIPVFALVALAGRFAEDAEPQAAQAT